MSSSIADERPSVVPPSDVARVLLETVVTMLPPLAVPTLVRQLPEPIKKIGDLSSRDRVLIGLDLRPAVASR